MHSQAVLQAVSNNDRDDNSDRRSESASSDESVVGRPVDSKGSGQFDSPDAHDSEDAASLDTIDAQTSDSMLDSDSLPESGISKQSDAATDETSSPDDLPTIAPPPDQESNDSSEDGLWATELSEADLPIGDTDRGSSGTAPTIDIPAEFTASMADGFDSSNAAHRTLPKSIGKFHVVRELGRGAFGVVYLARDEALDRKVAIKLSLVEDVAYQKRLLVEASNVAKVEGDHIVPVLHVDRTEFGAVYIVQKYIDGCTLGDWVRRHDRPSPGQVMILMYHLGLGLMTAHRQDMLHRDLKPDNILLDVNGVPWIVDFGLAISEQEQVGRRRELAGTPPYMSPEQIRGRVDFMDARSDIWALGVIYYELLSGGLPFAGRTRDQLAEQICQRDPKSLHQRDPDRLTEDMDALFRRCCAKEPSQRFASVDELSNALLDLIRQHAKPEDFERPLGLDSVRATVTPFDRGSPSARTGLSTLRDSLVSQRGVMTDQRTLVGGTLDGLPNRKRKLTGFAAISVGIASLIIAAIFHQPILALLRSPDPSTLVPDAGPSTAVAGGFAGDRMELEIGDPETAPEDASDSPMDSLLVPHDADAGPRRVAVDGPANHRRIQEAIDAAADGETIQIAAGYYRESLRLQRSIRLEAAPDAQSRPVVIGDGASPVTVNGQATVTLTGLEIAARDLYEDASGIPSPSRFNTIEVLQGTLGLKDCDISKASFGDDDNYNAVKVHPAASLALLECRFGSSPGFSVSAKDASSVQISDCAFTASGVQLVASPAVISGCQFAGDIGIQVQEPTDRPVRLDGCQFNAARQFAVNVTAGGRLAMSGNSFEDCSRGVWMVRHDRDSLIGDPDADVTMLPPVVQITGDVFTRCDTAIDMSGGQLKVAGDCQIEGGGTAVLIQAGDVGMDDVQIRESQLAGIRIAKDAGQIELHNVEVDAGRDTGIWIEACESCKILDSRLTNCIAAGLTLTGGRAELDGLTVTNSGVGVQALQSAAVDKAVRMEISDCDHGMMFQPDAEHAIELAIRDSVFDRCGTVAIYASRDVNLTVADTEFRSIPGPRQFYAINGAQINEAKVNKAQGNEAPISQP